MLAESMTLYGGVYREEAIIVQVTRIGAGAGETGIWTVLPDDGPIRALHASAPAKS